MTQMDLAGIKQRPALVLIGHSHTETVIAAASAAGVAIDELNFWQLPDPFVYENEVLRLKPALAARLRGPVFSLVGGAVHQDVGLVVHPAPFDFIWPDNPDLPLTEDAAVIPFDAVYHAMFERTRHFRDIMSAVRSACDGPVFHIESPPTYGPEELPQDDAGFAHFFGKDARFSPPWLRYKLWRVHSAIIAAHCREIGIDFVPHPAEAVDADGFMRAPFHGTPAHANAAYGALILAQMQAIAAQIPAAAPVAAADAVAAVAPDLPVQDWPVQGWPVEGWIDGCKDGVIQGWAWRPDAPADKVMLEVLAGGTLVGSGLAVLPRADLAALGKDGACGFAIALDRDAFEAGHGTVEAVVRARGGADLDGGPVQVDLADRGRWPAASRAPLIWPPVPWRFSDGLLGHIDRFGPDIIDGWAQTVQSPSAPVALEIWQAGVRAGTVKADIWRQDLEEMRQGDGRWGLSAAMPASLRDGKPHRIDVRLPDGGNALGFAAFVQLPAADGLVLPAQVAIESAMEVASRRVRPARRDAPPDVLFSIVVNFYNMQREAARTLTSLSRLYQRDIGGLRYEVLCIDNFSDPPLDREWVESFGPEFRLVVPQHRLPSPCRAINEAASQAHGRYLAIMIDGAHVLTPGALREVWDAVSEAPGSVVALRQWFVGGDQRWLATVGYTRAQEDILFDKIAWPSDGYKLFRVGAPYWESPKPWFDAMIESNCLFVPRTLYRDIGGMDEAFSEAGAGYANLDLFRRATDASPEPLIALLGEATFHQFHDGTTTNVTLEMKEQRVRAYESHYVEIRGKPYPVTQAVDIRLRGQIRTLQAISSWQRPSSPARIGATDRIRPGSLTLQFDDTAQEYAQSVYVEAGLHEHTTWLGHKLDMAPSDAMAIQDIIFRTRPDRIVAVNVAAGVIMLLDSVLALVDLPAARIVAVGELSGDMPARVTRVAGRAASAATLAAVRTALAAEERVLVLFAPDEEDLMPFDALRAFAGLVTPRSYLIFLGTAFGQPWLGYSTHWYLTAIRRLLDTEPFAIDANCNPHLISTSPLGYLQRIEPPPHIADLAMTAPE